MGIAIPIYKCWHLAIMHNIITITTKFIFNIDYLYKVWYNMLKIYKHFDDITFDIVQHTEQEVLYE